ncbi:CLUMA_CG013265, isoform A [Clunio marinus]|uniref:CLUMA_CG013265, isoform A n=1 Tax=Clunio marinus TaxID=568069 RepID=A0A1J1IJN0_9DIPT|nr:CLUMA_CG013265, isoform A [Clunio marinus]
MNKIRSHRSTIFDLKDVYIHVTLFIDDFKIAIVIFTGKFFGGKKKEKYNSDILLCHHSQSVASKSKEIKTSHDVFCKTLISRLFFSNLYGKWLCELLMTTL